MRMNKEMLLDAIDRGRDFFVHTLPNLKLATSTRYDNISSPFRNDKKPSFSVYFNMEFEKWMFNDFGDPDTRGDVFDFAALIYGLDVKEDFFGIMKRIANDLKLELETIQDEPEFEINDSGWATGFKLKFSDDDLGIEAAYNYFKQFGITREVLCEYQVTSISGYGIIKNNKIKTVRNKIGQLMIAYDAGYFAKVYTPYPVKNFWYIGQKQREYVFGYREIMNRNRRGFSANREKYTPREILVLTGGEKDVLTLASLGYDAISMNSETGTTLPKNVVELFSNYRRVVVLYDLDTTGIASSRMIAEGYAEVISIQLPDDLKERNGKDVSDYVKLGMDMGHLRDLIEKGRTVEVSQVSPLAGECKRELFQNDIIPSHVYNLLPDFLKEITGQFADEIERDLVLLSALGALSSCFPNIGGKYAGKSIGLNLYLFVLAPASSGKGVMDWSLKLVDKIDDQLQEIYQREHKQYLESQSTYKTDKRRNPSLLLPEEPVQQRLYIPANSSNSAITELLCNNKDFGLIFETEADTLTTALKNDWANFSDILRKAFHHEKISMARRENDEYASAANPHLSVVLSGTPSQVESFIESVENGYFSRFMYYDFKSPLIWKNMFDAYGDELESNFERYGTTLRNFWEKCKVSGKIRIDLKEHQKDQCRSFFEQKQQELFSRHGDGIVASIRRHAVMAYRISMLLAFLRNVDSNDELATQQYVYDDDFNAAIEIIDVLLKHLERVYGRLQRKTKSAGMSHLKKQLYEALPEQFTTKECMIEIAPAIGMNAKTAEKYLRDFMDDGKLEKIKHGQYRKL